MSMPAEQLHTTPTLADLLRGCASAPAIPIQGIASDSRQLGEDYLFLAVAGMSNHGLDFLEAAVAAGVAAVAWDASTGSAPPDIGVPTIAVDDLAAQLGDIADRFHACPSEHLGVIGVTGTNGKSTVAWMVAQASTLLGHRCGYLGTLGFGVDEIVGAEGMTTPPAVELHGRLAEFVDAGAEYAALEVSSHALSQGRVDGVRFDTAIFTNLSRDHLDYHADMRAYFESKARLFLECAPANSIINIDSDYGAQLADRCGSDAVVVTTSPDRNGPGGRYLSVMSINATAQGSNVEFSSSWGAGVFALPLPGDFNVANAAAVLAFLLTKGVALQKACDVMSQLQAPPGRMQRVATEGPAVYVDYAHTPSALQSALDALRPHCRGHLWCLFGCGGDRDAGKRPRMGDAAERFADRIVITNDNPRSEDPQKIVEGIVAGLVHPERATILEDRAAAIAWVIEQAADEDVVLLAGKGHEEFQEAGGVRVPFSDCALAAAALAAKEAGA
jgi:UDP-N-acetylmuramoyl-L-alanyl-D-glutamate--2,6-diaminopimelate ligase